MLLQVRNPFISSKMRSYKLHALVLLTSAAFAILLAFSVPCCLLAAQREWCFRVTREIHCSVCAG